MRARQQLISLRRTAALYNDMIWQYPPLASMTLRSELGVQGLMLSGTASTTTIKAAFPIRPVLLFPLLLFAPTHLFCFHAPDAVPAYAARTRTDRRSYSYRSRALVPAPKHAWRKQESRTPLPGPEIIPELTSRSPTRRSRRPCPCTHRSRYGPPPDCLPTSLPRYEKPAPPPRRRTNASRTPDSDSTCTKILRTRRVSGR